MKKRWRWVSVTIWPLNLHWSLRKTFIISYHVLSSYLGNFCFCTNWNKVHVKCHFLDISNYYENKYYLKCTSDTFSYMQYYFNLYFGRWIVPIVYVISSQCYLSVINIQVIEWQNSLWESSILLLSLVNNIFMLHVQLRSLHCNVILYHAMHVLFGYKFALSGFNYSATTFLQQPKL